MFGKITGFFKDIIYVENLKGIADTNYIGYHVIFEDTQHKIVGEIVSINQTQIDILLIGEIINGVFSSGCLKKPGVNTVARIIYKSELELILGDQNYINKQNLLLGSSPIYSDYVITCPTNEFFSNHFAILGNTGSGKSCGITNILQNIFYAGEDKAPKNAHIVLFDAYGEYVNTFNKMEETPGLHYKRISTETKFGNGEVLNIPAYFLDTDDIAILLNITDKAQLPVISKAIELVKIFKSKEAKAIEYKNDIIARCCLDILSSGKTASQVRDQLTSILSSYNTESLNLNSVISQPGYDRTLRQCLIIDDQGKINAINFVVEFFQKYIKVDLDADKLSKDVIYSLKDLYYALEFALINEGALVSDSVFERNNNLKAHLQTIINSPDEEYFAPGVEYITKDQYVRNFFSVNGTDTAQLVDVNLSCLSDEIAKAITKIYSRLFFGFTTSLEERGSFAIHILLEEAHRYVQNDKDIDVLGYNIFDRITKEGRKYGTILGFITQRPNELSKTALSQCSNFCIFRLFYPEDFEIVKGISSNVTDETLEKIKTLHPGTGLCFGTAFKVPLLVKFPLPNPLPISTSLKIDSVWY